MNRDREPSRPAPFELEAAADQAIAACGRDTREAVKALIVANGFLEAQVEDCEPRFPRLLARPVRRPRDRPPN